MLEVRDRIERGEQVGPRILNSGPYFGFARRGWNDNITLDELRTEVDAWAARGIRSIKAKGLTPEQMRVVIDQAHLRGLTVTSHLYNDANYVNTVPVREAISMGIDRLEHYIGEPARLIDGSVAPGDPEFNANLQLFLDNEVYFAATVSVYATFGADPDPALFDDDWADERRFFTPHTNELAAQRAGGGQTYRRQSFSRRRPPTAPARWGWTTGWARSSRKAGGPGGSAGQPTRGHPERPPREGRDEGRKVL